MPPEYTLRNLHFAFPSDAESHLKMIGVDPYGIEAMLPKMRHLCIFVEGLECKVANIIKQEMLSVGGDAAVARGSVSCSIERTDAILMGTAKQFNRFAEKISDQPFGLREMSKNLKDLLSKEFLDSIVLHTPKREIYFGKKTFIMGILNVTPDSFSTRKISIAGKGYCSRFTIG
jgi:dihydropteroate synthase